jgi:hypothetical protein
LFMFVRSFRMIICLLDGSASENVAGIQKSC